jgi:hypothetical protein
MIIMTIRFVFALLVLSGTMLVQSSIQQTSDKPTPEARAVAFLGREVPEWSRKNECFSCHNNGDAARALYLAQFKSYEVPAMALTATNLWVSRFSHHVGNAFDNVDGYQGFAAGRFKQLA